MIDRSTWPTHSYNGSGCGELQTGTSHKRALTRRTESDLEILKRLQQSFDDCNRQQAILKRTRPLSGGFFGGASKRGRTLSPHGRHAESVEHAVPAMSGRSPELLGNHQLKEVISLEDVTEVPAPPSPYRKLSENEGSIDAYVRVSYFVSDRAVVAIHP